MTAPEREAILRQIAKLNTEVEFLHRQIAAAIEPDLARGISEARFQTRLELATAPFRYTRPQR